MQKIKKYMVALLFIMFGFGYANAQTTIKRVSAKPVAMQPVSRSFAADTVPTRAVVKPTTIKTTDNRAVLQVKTVQPVQKTPAVLQPAVRPQPVQNTPVVVQPVVVQPVVKPKPAQYTPVVLHAVEKKDTTLIRRLTETYKFKKATTQAERVKITLLIDSVYKDSKTNPKNTSGEAAPDYQDLVRIIDSLLKANKYDSEKVVIDTPVIIKRDTIFVGIKEPVKNSEDSGQTYWWLIAVAAPLLAGLAFFIMKRKKGASADPKIFFSYAWDQDEALIVQLYNSLKKDGFNVIKDKENIGYKGVISKFMEEIGSADFVIVAISDKYLRSRFCMYELYEIFRNSGMNSDRFGKKIFPIRIDESINLSDPDVVNGYARYWKQEEQEWTQRMKNESDSITEEQAKQFQFIKRLVNDVNNILSCLADINSLNLSTLKGNDFADIKKALRAAM